MRKVKLALAQMMSKSQRVDENIRRMEKATVEAKEKNADLIIFPELFLTGYSVKDRIYELAEPIPGPATKEIAKIAKGHHIHIIFGMPELDLKTEATLFNSAVLVQPNGAVKRYRKMYLPNHSVFEEKRRFRAGYQSATFDTALGKIGLCICYDLFFPEVTRLMRLNGAKLIVCVSASPALRRSYFETLTSARALENTAFLAYVNLVGVEEGLQFWGGSRLINPTGDVIARAKYEEEDLLLCDIDFSDMRTAEVSIPTLRDLRPELYDQLKKCALQF